jgi:hypothetical protein
MASNGGLHVGRPHASASDPQTHVTLTHRDPTTGSVTGPREHRSTMGAIAIGQAAYESAQEAKEAKKASE